MKNIEWIICAMTKHNLTQDSVITYRIRDNTNIPIRIGNIINAYISLNSNDQATLRNKYISNLFFANSKKEAKSQLRAMYIDLVSRGVLNGWRYRYRRNKT